MSEETPDVPEFAQDGRAPFLIRALGLGALGFGVFLALVMAIAIVGTQYTFGDVDVAGTVADWTSAFALVIIGVGLLRGRTWAGIAGWIAGSGLMAFGLFWAIWGNSDTGPGAPFPDILTGAAYPWPVFFVPGVIIVVTLGLPQSRTWLRERGSSHQHR
jgi:hypothetical protein